eukprot:m.190890 g.190890  ORF g.190890 m.190890 type:complete len:190 (-) comp32415_c6_seq1:101-670(-)
MLHQLQQFVEVTRRHHEVEKVLNHVRVFSVDLVDFGKTNYMWFLQKLFEKCLAIRSLSQLFRSLQDDLVDKRGVSTLTRRASVSVGLIIGGTCRARIRMDTTSSSEITTSSSTSTSTTHVIGPFSATTSSTSTSTSASTATVTTATFTTRSTSASTTAATATAATASSITTFVKHAVIPRRNNTGYGPS